MTILIIFLLFISVGLIIFFLKWDCARYEISNLEWEKTNLIKILENKNKELSTKIKEKKMATKLGQKVYFMQQTKEKVESDNGIKINLIITKGNGIIIAYDDEKESIKTDTDILVLSCNRTWNTEAERDKAIDTFYNNIK